MPTIGHLWEELDGDVPSEDLSPDFAAAPLPDDAALQDTAELVPGWDPELVSADLTEPALANDWLDLNASTPEFETTVLAIGEQSVSANSGQVDELNAAEEVFLAIETPRSELTAVEESDSLATVVAVSDEQAVGDDGDVIQLDQAVAEESETPDMFVVANDDPDTGDDVAAAPERPAADIAEVEIFRERFRDGSPRIEREVTLDGNDNYVDHGMYRQWSEHRTLIAEGRSEMGRRVGEWRRAYASDESELFSQPPFKLFKGPFISSATFRNGKLHGTWTIRDSEDRVASHIDFVDGARHGSLLYFYPNGSKMREIEFRNGVVDGYLREFDEAGMVTLEREYTDGHYATVKIETYASTIKKSETNLLYSRMTIKTPDDWWNAKIAEYGIEAGEPLRHGLQSVWYENGQLRFRGQFDSGKATGEFVWYQDNGQISRSGQYVDGKQNGSWSWWHNDGSKAVMGKYDHGTPVGRWLFWKPGGELEQVKDLSAAGRPAPEGGPVDERSQSAPTLPETSA